eukprot:scaffold96497_cov47-Attheya_sp.AAC.3
MDGTDNKKNAIGARSSQKEDGDRSYESSNDVQQSSSFLRLPFFWIFFMNQKQDSGATIKYIEWMKQSTMSNPLANSMIPSSFIIITLMATFGSLMAWIPQSFGVMAKLITSSVGKGAKWYMANLEAAPLITKAISAGIIALFGDYGAQWFAYRLKHGKRNTSSADMRSGSSEERVTFQNYKQQPWWSIRGNYDIRRGLAVLSDGIFITGPIMHFAYTALEKFIPTTGGNRSLAALSHCIADSVILDALFVANVILTTGIIEGYDFKTQVLEQFRNGDYLDAIKASWLMSTAFLPLEFVFFRFLPVSLRVLAVNITDIVWGSVISFAAHKSRGSTNPSHSSSVSSLQQAMHDDSKLEPVQQPRLVAQPSM